MYQPKVKLKFVLHNCKPSDGWHVYVDIDSSEKGETGGERKTDKAKDRQKKMKKQAQEVVKHFGGLDVQVNGGLKVWLNGIQQKNKGLPLPEIFGDRDIVALNLVS